MARDELETGALRVREPNLADDAIADRLFTLVDMKLALDNVTLDDSRLESRCGKGDPHGCRRLRDKFSATEEIRSPKRMGEARLYTILRWIGLWTRRPCG
jgi:hypothetical protein